MSGSRLEFSRVIDLSTIGTNTVTKHLEATEAERAGLAKRFGAISIPRFEAEISLRRTMGDKGAELRGSLSADVVQECVVSGESMKSEVSSEFTVRFLPEALLQSEDEEIFVDPDDEDVEFFCGEVIEYGDVVAQHLSLAIPEYPRKKNAQMPQAHSPEASGKEENGHDNPFSVLQKYKDKA